MIVRFVLLARVMLFASLAVMFCSKPQSDVMCSVHVPEVRITPEGHITCEAGFTFRAAEHIVQKASFVLLDKRRFLLVEVRRIELLSEDRITAFSPSAVCILDFPSPNACKRA